MKKNVAIPVSFLDTCPLIVKSDTILRSMRIAAERLPDIPLELCRDGITKADLVKHKEISFTFDYALPINLVNTIREKLGYELSNDFIWSMKTNWLYPLTYKGECLLPIINHILERVEL